MAQVVAGTLIKELVPVGGEFLGNVLINTGIDDISFGVSSAIRHEFCWDDYWRAKKGSLRSALKSAALVSAASAISSLARPGAEMAWRQKRMSHVQKLRLMAHSDKAAPIILASHIGRQVGRSLLNAGVADLAGRGINSVVHEIAGTFADGLKDNVHRSVANRWQAVEEQARALFDSLQGDASALGAVRDSVREVLQRAGREHVFTSVVRTSKPALGRAAANVSHSGWAAVAAYGGDLAHLGVSTALMARLVETQTNQLARAIRAAKDRQRPTAAPSNPEANEALEALLAAQKSVFSDGLVAVINSLLQASIYGPLVSMSAQQVASGAVSWISPQGRVELLANDSDKVAQALEHTDNPATAFEDALFRNWRGGVRPVDRSEMTAAQLNDMSYEAVEGTDASVNQLVGNYGSSTVFYRDPQGRLYVQRPRCEGYADGVEAGKPAGEPEFRAVAINSGRDITLVHAVTGELTTYLADGGIVDTAPAHAVRLYWTPGKRGGPGHVSPTQQVSSDLNTYGQGNDCFYAAFIQQAGLEAGTNVVALRQSVAHYLRTDTQAQLDYHNWSLQGDVKQFCGLVPLAAAAGAGVVGGVMGLTLELYSRHNDPWDGTKFAHLAWGTAFGAAAAIPWTGPFAASARWFPTATRAVAWSLPLIESAAFGAAYETLDVALGQAPASQIALGAAEGLMCGSVGLGVQQALAKTLELPPLKRWAMKGVLERYERVMMRMRDESRPHNVLNTYRGADKSHIRYVEHGTWEYARDRAKEARGWFRPYLSRADGTYCVHIDAKRTSVARPYSSQGQPTFSEQLKKQKGQKDGSKFRMGPEVRKR